MDSLAPMPSSKIIYTFTDEAPALATCSLLPIIQAFASTAGVEVETRDISLAGRILAAFPDHLTEAQRVPDALAELGELVTRPEANVIKLPNVSASLPQLREAIEELQGKGYALPDYPDEPEDDAEREILARYERIKGSAVNPVIREGNSDRRAAASVKQYARSNPHSMGAWTKSSKTHVSSMSSGDFRSNEQSVTVTDATDVRIELVSADGTTTVLKESTPLLPGEVIDGTVMRKAELVAFLTEQIADAKAKGVLFSLHLKATMMKVSDPIIFGHAVEAFLPDLFAEHGAALDAAGISPNDGLASLFENLDALPADVRAAVEAGVEQGLADGPDLAMVDSDHGITNLHVPSDVIVDASMPAMIRTSGQMWNAAGEPQDAKAVIPDSSYGGIYQVVIDDCRAHGAYDPATMGSVPNVGLMAQKAEEYGSHDKTFEIPSPGPRARHRCRRRDPRRARGGAGRHLADVPDEGCRGEGLGEAGGHARPRHRRAGRVLARRVARPRRAAHREGARATSRSTRPTACRSRSWRRSTPSPTRSSASAAARTRSRSPATCCATTSPTCSRSSSWAPAPRCSRSSR